MKKLLLSLAIICLASIASMAQPYRSFGISNRTSCTIYVQLFGTKSWNGCNTDYQSSVIAIVPGTGGNYPNPTMVPGGMNKAGFPPLNSGDGFTMVRVFHGPPSIACITLGYASLSDGCVAGTSTFVSPWALETYSGGCSTCNASANITWVTVSPSAAYIIVD